MYSRPNITLSTRRFFTGIFAWTKLCISFVTRGYTLLIMAQKSHSRVYLCQHFESQGDEERLEAVLLGKDAPENWQRAAMNLAID